MAANSQSPDAARAALAPAVAHDLSPLVDYSPGAVVSRTLAGGTAGTLTLFAFDSGQGLSEHSAPFDAWVLAVDGRATLTIGGKPVLVQPGQLVLMPAHVPHAVTAEQRFKMLLVMIKNAATP